MIRSVVFFRAMAAVALVLTVACGASKKHEESGTPDRTEQKSSLNGNGNIVGNGGAGVVCRDGSQKILSVEPLDTYEGRTVRNLAPQMPEVIGAEQENAAAVFDRLNVHDPERAAEFITAVEEFGTSNAFLRNTRLPKTEDYGSFILANNCEIEQIIVQRETKISTDKRYLVDADLWERLDVTGKTALITHEAIYKDALNRGHFDSFYVRNFNMLLLSNEISSMSADQYAATMLENYMNEYVGGSLTTEVVRYFPHLSVTRDEAVEFCASLGNNTALWNGGVIAGPGRSESYTRAIIGADGHGSREVWASDVRYFDVTNYNALVFKQVFDRVTRDPALKLGVMCATPSGANARGVKRW